MNLTDYHSQAVTLLLKIFDISNDEKLLKLVCKMLKKLSQGNSDVTQNVNKSLSELAVSLTAEAKI